MMVAGAPVGLGPGRFLAPPVPKAPNWRSGGCFPSAHVSGTWALTFGLALSRPKSAFWFGLLALGLSVACVYTRYHHAVDVFAGVAVAAVAAAIGYFLTRRAHTV